MSKTYRVLTFLTLATLALALALPPGTLAAPGPIKIGAAGPFTGDLSKIGLDSLNAIQMAVDEVNQAGGIKGRKVQVVIGDDAADPAKSLLVAEKFGADSGIVGVIGPMNSSTAAASLPAYQSAGLVVISQSATTPDLTEKGYSVFHRICPRDDAQGPVAAKFAVQELKARRIYVLDDKSTYGQGLADQVTQALKGLGVKDLFRGQISGEDKDFSAILTRIKALKPDLIFMALPNPAQAAAFVKQAAGLGVKAKFMAGDGVKERDQYIKGAAGLAEGSYVTAIGQSLREVPEARDFVARFEKKYGAMSIFSGQSYEATKLLLTAIRKVADQGSVTRAKVLKAVHEIDGYRGILGFPIEFDRKGDVVGSKIYVFQVKGGDFVEVKGYAANTK